MLSVSKLLQRDAVIQAGDESLEDSDFYERVRRDRTRRLIRGFRNGIGAMSILRLRMGFTQSIKFHGVLVRQSDNQATYRAIEDIWMRGEYDLEGFVPRQGRNVIDVGANVGIYAMLAASRGAHVVAYEPTPTAFARLKENTSRWNVKCCQAAVVGKRRPSVRLLLHPLRDTRNRIVASECINQSISMDPNDVKISLKSIIVPAVSIDDVLAEPCDLLKIDCEASEYDILFSAGQSLRRAARIIFEADDAAGGGYGGIAGLIAQVRRAGFDVQPRGAYPGTSFQMITAVRI